MNIEELPPVFETEDYFKCIQKGYTFCMVVAKLGLDFIENSIWKKKLGVEREMAWHLDRRYLHRGLCLSEGKHWEQDVITQTKFLLKNQISQQNFTTDIAAIHCQGEIMPLTTVDVLFLLSVFAFFCFVIFGTAIDTPERIPKWTSEKLLLTFSLKRNWNNITRTTGNEDFNKLKSIQGIRALTNFGVICTHTTLNLFMMYYSNPEVLEIFLRHPVARGFCIFAVFFVHVFLMISGFLFSNQVFSHYDRNGFFTAKDLFIFAINRYFRLITPTLVFVFFSQTSILEPYLGVPAMKLYAANKRACKFQWTGTVLFHNNFRSFTNICYAASWYLSADYHGYLVLAFIMYFILKFRLNILKAMLIALMTSVFTFAIYIHLSGMKDVLYVPTLRDIQQKYLTDVNAFIVLYTSTISTLPSSITGMIFGYLYFRSKKNKIEGIIKNPVYDGLWFIIIIGILFNCVYVGMFAYNKFLTAALGSIIKVVFTAAVATAIIGFSLGLGGKVKSLAESRVCLTLGNISFCTYLFNFSIMILSNVGRTDLRTLSLSFAGQKLFYEVVLSFIGGFTFALAVEQPPLSIQKMYLPQIRKKKAETEKE